MPPEVVVVPHTHWDREWYRTFQGYRLRMVEAVERILELLEQGVLPHFLLDGQTVMLDDYLEIRPQDAPRLRSAIESGKLGIGPWYILPDEFLVSGEALIRNLLFGRERMERFGACGAVGYLPDMFGHTAQMPQILRGFGMDRAVVWRGVDPSFEHFWWEDLGGGGIATVFLPTGYCNTHLWHRDLAPCDRQNRHREYLNAHKLAGPHLLLSGCDHLAPNSDLPALAQAMGARLGRLDDALVPPGRGALQVIRGELRQQGRAYLLPDVASARMPLKQVNAALQDLWERSVEPLLALRVLAGDRIDAGFVREGWELILKNQPHDSICGCSIDTVHQEMGARSSQARILGEELAARTLDAFASSEEAPGVIVFNPSGWRRSGWTEIQTEAPSSNDPGWQEAHLEGVPAVFLGAQECQRFYADIDLHPDTKPVRLYRFLAYFRDLPPVGLTTFPLAKGPGEPGGAPLGVLTGDTAIENEFLRIEIVEGRLRLLHKPTGVVVGDLLRLVDEGDAGDEYTYSPPPEDRLKGARLVDYEVSEASGARATLTVQYEMRIPAALTPDRTSRALLSVRTAIQIRMTLVAGEQTAHFDVSLENWAQDHRLRLLVGTGITDPGHMASEAAFGAIERSVSVGLGELPVPPLGEAVPPTFPHQGWVAIEGSDLAMQVLTPGLPESEIVAEGSAVAITLLRCVGWLSRDDLQTRGGGAGPQMPTPEAQMEGPHHFVFHVRYDAPASAGKRAWWAALQELEQARHGLRIQATGGHRRPLARGLHRPAPLVGKLPCGAVLSAVKPSGDNVVVRLFNPTAEAQRFSLPDLARWHWQRCNLAETPLPEPVSPAEVVLEPGEIASFLLTPHRP